MNKINKYLILLTFSLSIIILCFIPFNATQFIPEIEEQVEKDLGVKIHIERLILRVGPTIKIKAPVMHLTYQNGKKFAQIDNAKFYLPWSSLLKKKPIFTALKANKLNVRINSDDEGLQDIINLLTQKSVEETPSLKIKEYSISYIDKVARDKFSLNGHLLETKKILKYNNFKISTKGEFLINSKKYITYDILLTPNLNFSKEKINIDVIKLIENIKELDFRADIITDLKLYKSVENKLQASGFINVDNITVLDVTQKGPKSFIYVTLWGDKASLLSNIYTSANQKVSIEGVINNSPKTNLDFKVKTDEIELKDLYKKLRILFDLSFLKNLEALDGKLNANFSIKGDINKIKSNGYLKINNASLKANGVAINKINSEIDFSNNNINIVKAVGYVLDSPIMAKGTINKNIDIEILMNKVELKHLCPSILGVKKGILSLVANITGSLENIIHKENLQISNLELSNDYGQIFLESLKIDTHRSAIANIDNIICKIPDLSTIKIPSMKLFIDDDTLRITDTNIFMQNSNFVLKSDVTNFNSKEFTFNTLLTGNINSKDISCLECLAQQYPVQLSINGNRIVQNLNLQLLLDEHSIFKEKTLANLISKVEKNIFKIEDLSLMSFDGTLTSDFKANMKGIKKLSINGVVENLAKPIMKNLRVYIPQQLNLNFLDSSVQIKGDMFLNGDFTQPEIVGQLSVQNLFNESSQLSLTNATVDFNKNVAVVNIPVLRIADNILGMNALLSTDIKERLIVKNANIKSKFINTDTLLMYKDTPLFKMLPLEVQEGKFYSERVNGNIYGSQLYITALSSDFKLQNELLSLNNLNCELYNGKLAGTLYFNLKDEHFDAKIMGRGLSAAPVFDLISKRKDTISGIVDFDSIFNGNLISKKDLIGNLKFIVTNGRMSTLGKLEHLLYAQNVIADSMLRTSLNMVTKAITLKDTGLFKYLKGEVELDKGIAKINFLQSQGPLMSLFIKGLYNIETDYAQLTVLGRLADEIITGLGAFGDFSFNKLMLMLTGEERNNSIVAEDIDKLPQLQSKNTKEFRTLINGIIDKPSSVILFNWISYSTKSLRQKDVPMNKTKIPDFLEALPY